MKFETICHFLALIAIVLLGCRQAQKGLPADSTFQDIAERLKNDQGFAASNADFEGKIKSELERNKRIGDAALPFNVITIPVVVHLVQEAGANPVADQLVEQQIAALNRDFRRKNADELAKVPEAFRVLAADTRIQFALARRSPTAKATNGIVRTTAGKASFGFAPLDSNRETRNQVKFKASGGNDAWPSDSYLNIWVCRLDDKLREGYASLPADLPSRATEDGAVIDVDYFGFSALGRNKGRALTNLVAKWLGLKDIWGMGSAIGSDEVADTPPQEGPNNGMASYPYFNRAESPYGDMYCNFMDATDDDQRLMFSAGQADRIYAVMQTLRGPMQDSEGNADEAGPGAGPVYFIKDFPTDVGTEASGPSAYYYADGIAVNQNSTANDMSESGSNVTTGAGITNYIHVRVNRSSTGASSSSDNLHVYWADASTGNNDWYDAARWTEIGTGYNVYTGWSSNVRYINPPIPLPSGLPSDHICIIARLEDETTCPNRSCNGSAGNPLVGLSTYVRFNRNAAWQNLDIVASPPEEDMQASPGQRGPQTETRFANFRETPAKARLVFNNMAAETPIFNYAKIAVSSRRLLELWEQGGRQGEGIEQKDSQIVVLKAGAYIGLNIPPGENNKMQIRFLADEKTPNQRDIYLLNLEQEEDSGNAKYETRGGVVFALKAEHGEMPPPPPEEKSWWKWIGLGLLAVVLIWILLRPKGGAKYANTSDK